MESSKFDEFLTEKQKLEDFLQKLEIELNTCEEDFEKVKLEKLNALNELIKENSPYAIIVGNKFAENFFKFKNDFNRYVATFNEMKRFKMETALEDFLNTIQLLRKNLYE